MPSSLFTGNTDIVAPLIVMLFNRSPAHSLEPTVSKEAYITPIVKKADAEWGALV